MTATCCKMSNGSEIWMKDKKFHRDDGPAIWNEITKEAIFYIEGVRIDVNAWFELCGKDFVSDRQLTFLMLKYGLQTKKYSSYSGLTFVK